MSRMLTCTQCGILFNRYNITKKRAQNPQFCARPCQDAYRAERAKAGMAERFWSKVAKAGPDECWLWTAYRDPNGYGRFNRSQLATRIAYRLTTGQEPGKLFVCHSCDNPSCCNPAHLWLGSQKENVADMITKGRARRGRTTKLTPEQVLEVVGSSEHAHHFAARFGVSRTTIDGIRNGKTWNHVTGIVRRAG